jgi:hypothetical protein
MYPSRKLWASRQPLELALSRPSSFLIRRTPSTYITQPQENNLVGILSLWKRRHQILEWLVRNSTGRVQHMFCKRKQWWLEVSTKKCGLSILKPTFGNNSACIVSCPPALQDSHTQQTTSLHSLHLTSKDAEIYMTSVPVCRMSVEEAPTKTLKSPLGSAHS